MIIGAIILFSISATSFTISILSFLQKGYLFNNIYIGATKEKKEKMNKKPYYLQSGIVFLIIGVIFLLNGFDLLFETSWIILVVIPLIVIAIIYAIVSTILIEKKNKYIK